MKITICGSITYVVEMDECKHVLEKIGHEVQSPPVMVPDKDGILMHSLEQSKLRKQGDHSEAWMQDKKAELIHDHFNKVEWSDAVLIYNKDKHNIKNYIGANTLLEMGLAFYLNKKIFLLNPVPEISYKEEILGMKPIVINGDLELIK